MAKSPNNNQLGKFIAAKFYFTDDDNKAYEIQDPSFLPFYYFKGKEINPKNMLEIGFGLGICSGSFLLGNKSVEKFYAVQEYDSYYNSRLAARNIKRYYKKEFKFFNRLNHIQDFKPDFVIIREKDKTKMSNYLSFIWDSLVYDGILCCDYAADNKETINIFCKVRNTNYDYVDTRYGIALIRK